ncbi:MAG: hypothetical protein KAS73_03930 [Candidatus Sabulitectum sp.]|nr:hypothetical protein [Candidatus Sabulitectum sp.]
MAKSGTAKKPIIVRVQSEEKAAYVTEVCQENNWIFVLGMEPDKPENLSDLDASRNESSRSFSSRQRLQITVRA